MLTLGLLLGYAGWRLARPERTRASIRSVAVLPLKNLSGDPAQDYFADGTTDELITELARVPELRVVSWNSVIQEKDTKKSLQTIAGELRADLLVEGSVVRSGDRVRITAQLIDAQNDRHLWAETFEGAIGDILSLQDSIAREISLHAIAVLKPATRAELLTTKHVDPAAYDDYLRGLYFIQRREGDLAVSYFRKAIALEPDYAAANAGLAQALLTQRISKGEGLTGVGQSAIAAAERAIQLDPNSGEAYTALGAVDATYLWDWDAAEKNLRKGIELSPSSSEAESWYAIYLTFIGRPEEAVNAMQRALALDPLSFYNNRLLGSMLFYSRRYDESLVALKRALEIAPDKSGVVENWNAGDFEMQSRYRDAFEADMRELVSDVSPQEIAVLRKAFEKGGWKGFQEANVKYLLTRSTGECNGGLAMGYLRLDNLTEAFRWMNRDVDNHCGMLHVADPRFDRIRDDEHFRALLGRMNLSH